jgi:uncharacterized protein (DUF433 family)
MATAPKIVASALIAKTPGVCGGQAVIDGTRIRVKNIAVLLKAEQTPQQILVQYPSLSLAQVHYAIGYYYENQGEIEADITADERDVDEMDDHWREHVARNGGNPPLQPPPEERAIAKPVIAPAMSNP